MPPNSPKPGRASRRPTPIRGLSLLLAAALLATGLAATEGLAWYRERRLQRMQPSALRAWTESRPDDALAQFYLGIACGRSGDTSEAAARLSRALDLDPSLVRARWRLARLLAAAGQGDRAESLLLEGLRLEPAAAKLHAELGRLDEQRQQFRPALAEWTRATAMDPDDADAWYHRGLCSMSVNDEPRALQAYRRAAALIPTSATFQKALAGVLRLQGQYREAESHYGRALALDARDPDAHFGLGRLLWDRDGATEAAELQIRRAVVLEPDSPLLRYSLADLDRQRGHLAAACQEYQAALSLLEAREPPPQADWADRGQWLARLEGPHFNLARLLERLGRPAEAADHLARFRRISDYRNRANQLLVRIANRPAEAALHFDLARLHAAAGAPRLAEEEYRTGLRLHRDAGAQAELRTLAQSRAGRSLSGASETGKGPDVGADESR